MSGTVPSAALQLLEQYSTATEIVAYWARQRGDALAYAFLKDGETEDARLTFGSLDRRARAVGRWLEDHGGAGERALLLYPPGLDFLVGFVGCLYAGVVAVPLYPPRPNRRDQRIVDITLDADARFALTTSDTTATAARASEHSPELKALQWCATDAIASAADDAPILPAARPGDLAYLQYTSGSTRSPKGAMVTHGNLISQIADIELAVRHPPDSVFVTWLPHFHDMGLVYGLLTSGCLGFPCYVMPPASFLQRPSRWLSAISRYRGSHSGAPNFGFELCVQRVTGEQKRDLDLSSWKVAFSGAEPVRARTLEAFAETFAGCGLSKGALSPAYGLAEATLKVTVEPPGSEPVYLSLRASELVKHRVVPAAGDGPDIKTVVGCGVAVTTEILIVNPYTLAPCGPDEVGEIWLRGPSIAQGYWRRADETRSLFRATPAGDERREYLRTGDLGFLRGGELFVTGRHKDLIIIRGRNHYPQDIEFSVQSSHPAFQSQAGAAFSVDVGEEERLVLVQEIDRHFRTIDIDEISAVVRERIAEEHELSPHALVLVKQNGIPKTSSGKVQRHACARAFLDGQLPALAEWRDSSPIGGGPAPSESASRLEAGAPTQEEIETFVSQRLSDRLGVAVDDIDLRQPFSTLGLDSLMAMEFHGELETWLSRPLSPTLFWNYPTIADLAACLAAVPDPASAPIGQG
jgi:acyl-CoA synthetase (AMP-forming)/AMP-acid ligase II/acyl carrier protein